MQRLKRPEFAGVLADDIVRPGIGIARIIHQGSVIRGAQVDPFGDRLRGGVGQFVAAFGHVRVFLVQNQSQQVAVQRFAGDHRRSFGAAPQQTFARGQIKPRFHLLAAMTFQTGFRQHGPHRRFEKLQPFLHLLGMCGIKFGLQIGFAIRRAEQFRVAGNERNPNDRPQAKR